MRLRNAGLVAVGLLLVASMGIAGHALGEAAAADSGTAAPARLSWDDLLPQAWAPGVGGVVLPPQGPTTAAAAPAA